MKPGDTIRRVPGPVCERCGFDPEHPALRPPGLCCRDKRPEVVVERRPHRKPRFGLHDLGSLKERLEARRARVEAPGAAEELLRESMSAVQNVMRDFGQEHPADQRLARELLMVLRVAHDGLDRLMAHCITHDPKFRPTTSDAWPAVLAVTAAIKRAEQELNA